MFLALFKNDLNSIGPKGPSRRSRESRRRRVSYLRAEPANALCASLEKVPKSCSKLHLRSSRPQGRVLTPKLANCPIFQ